MKNIQYQNVIPAKAGTQQLSLRGPAGRRGRSNLLPSRNIKENFFKIYANLPLGVRQEIISVLPDGRPITWDAAFIEVKVNTSLSKIILKNLRKFDII